MGVPIAHEKTFGPSTTLSFLGIELDTLTMEARLPEEKLQKCRIWVSVACSSKKMKLRDIWKLLGLLNFTCKVVVPGRAFLRRLHNITRGIDKPHYHVLINKESKADLKAWQLFLESFNGKALYSFQPWVNSDCLHLFTDAAQSRGYGALFGCHWFHGVWPSTWRNKGIVLLELYPIMASLWIWGSDLKNKRIVIHTDNEALVAILNSSTSRDSEVMVLLRYLIIACMKFNIQIKSVHISGKRNILCDLLSRFQVDQFLKLAPWVANAPTRIPEQILPRNWFSQ